MSSPSINGRWQAEKCTVLQRNKFMFGNELMSDIKFEFPPNTERTTTVTIPAHKYVLAISSAVFLRELTERDNNTMVITDCDPEVFRCFLGFIYCDEANFQTVYFAIKVWHLAVKYDVPSLARECMSFLDGNMDPMEGFYMLTYARKFNDHGLEKACWEVIDYNAKAIAVDDSFLKISHEFLVAFLERSSLNIDEVALFISVDRWATKRCEEEGKAQDGANKRSELGCDLLKSIRFTSMSPNQFSDVVLPKDILTDQEIIAVYKNFHSDYATAESFEFSMLPRVTNDGPIFSCRMSTEAFLEANWPYVNESATLTFAVDKPILFCGLEFMFNPSATNGCVSVMLWREGVKFKQLSARSRVDLWINTENDSYEDQDGRPIIPNKSNKVFFNRPVQIFEDTCYTIELLGASSRSPHFYVANRTSGLKHYTSQSTISDCSIDTEVGFSFCGGLFAYKIPDNSPYIGHIECILWQL